MAAVLGLGVDAFLDKRRTVQELEALQVAVQVARDSVTLCQSELGIEEASFRVFDLQVDSLRQAVRAMESLDDGGVPGGQYGEYLTLFDEYNASVEVWEGRSVDLREAEARCRELVIDHNASVESLRTRVEAEGLGSP